MGSWYLNSIHAAWRLADALSKAVTLLLWQSPAWWGLLRLSAGRLPAASSVLVILEMGECV